MKKISRTGLVVLLALSLLAGTAFAASVDSVEKQRAANWLANSQNTQFDYEDTSAPDSLMDWTAFTLASVGHTPAAEYAPFLNAAVAESFDTLYPGDLARIFLSAAACGMQVRSVGGHDLAAALGAVNYTAQIYLSSLSFPLLAMHYDAQIPFADDIKQSIVTTILAAQQPDGGFPYCTVDTGYGISSDADTTAMALQALAPYCAENAAVQAAVDRALPYLRTQQFDDAAFGSVAWNSKSGETTAQVILALCALGIDPTDAVYCKGDLTPVDALKTFLSPNGGGLNYAQAEDPLTTYQILQGLEAVERFQNGEAGLFTYVPASEPGSDATPDATEPVTAATADTPVQIPQTGAERTLGVVVLSLGAAVALCLRKKDV